MARFIPSVGMNVDFKSLGTGPQAGTFEEALTGTFPSGNNLALAKEGVHRDRQLRRRGKDKKKWT
jgi:hypothetical protein